MAKKLWGGRFKKEIDRDFFEFQKSIHYDYNLAKYDLYHSWIHVTALKNSGILTNDEAKKLHAALEGVLKEIKENKFKPNLNSEDIHTEIQNKIEKKTGSLAGKLHTLRSRNDQIAFDEKFYCKQEAEKINQYLSEVQASLKSLSIQHKGLNIPGYTHTQRAQAVKFSDYLGAHIVMFKNDQKRLKNFSDNLIIQLGSGAFKGTSLTKEYDKAIKVFLQQKIAPDFCGKLAVVDNALVNVSDRDFIIEFLSALSIIQMHLSRLAEDFILYSAKEFNYFDLPEEFCTGSSLMPHKKNPDFLELVRGYTGRIYGNLVSLLTMMKGLPLTYNRDMQLDKEPLFSSVDIVKAELKILAKFIKGVKLNKDVIKKALQDESLYATDLAEYLVMKKVTFSQAHEIVGKLIRYSEDNRCKIKQMEEGLLKKFCPYLSKEAINKIYHF